jgi:hypothetical protein
MYQRLYINSISFVLCRYCNARNLGVYLRAGFRNSYISHIQKKRSQRASCIAFVLRENDGLFILNSSTWIPMEQTEPKLEFDKEVKIDLWSEMGVYVRPYANWIWFDNSTTRLRSNTIERSLEKINIVEIDLIDSFIPFKIKGQVYFE